MQAQAQMQTTEVELETACSITFLNRSGDITITWDSDDAQRREQVLNMIRAKMKDGYVFFTMAKVPLVHVQRKTRVSNKNIDTLNNVIIPDNEFDRLMAGIDDPDVAGLLQRKEVSLVKRRAIADMLQRKARNAQANWGAAQQRAFDTLKRVDDAEEVLRSQSFATRRMLGG